MTIRVGLVGFGLSGRIFHAPFILHDPDMELVCVSTSQAEEVSKVASQARVVADVEEVLTAQDVDLVVITSPNAVHFEQAKQALEQGKHVLLEKPSVTSIQEIQQLCALSKEQERIFCVYQNRRFDGDFQRLRALIKSGELGELKQLDSRFDRFRPIPQVRWREEPGVGAGIFWDLGPHLLDQTLCLMGEPDWIQACIDTLREGGKTADTFELELGYGKTRVRLGHSSFEAGNMRRFNARFSGGSWQCHGLDPQEDALRSGQMPWHSGFPDQAAQQSITRYIAPTASDISVQEEVADAGQYTAFYRQLALAIQGKADSPVPLEDACHLVYALLLAEQSSHSCQRLAWNYA
ncbi:Gfo/Idh/MocA family oxidoreductase [Marinomonas epiphytica]